MAPPRHRLDNASLSSGRGAARSLVQRHVLERHAALEALIPCHLDGAHPAAAEEALDPVGPRRRGWVAFSDMLLPRRRGAEVPGEGVEVTEDVAGGAGGLATGG